MAKQGDIDRLRPPVQARSRATLERIGNAVAELLREKAFDDITIQEVLARAKTSVGSFYARFAGKRALLDWFNVNYFEKSREKMKNLFEPEQWRNVSLQALLTTLVREYVTFVREHEHVLRPIVLENRARPSSTLLEASRPLNSEAYSGVVDLVLTKKAEINHPNPEVAVRIGLASLFAATHELILFRHCGLQDLDLSDDVLAAELARGFGAQLGVRWIYEKTGARNRRPPSPSDAD